MEHRTWNASPYRCSAEIENVNEALLVLEGKASANRLALRRAIEYRDRTKVEVVIVCEKIQVVKRSPNATFDYPELHSSNDRRPRLQCRKVRSPTCVAHADSIQTGRARH